MKKSLPAISPAFKAQLRWAIFGLSVFVFSYFFLLLLAFAIIALSVLVGIYIVSAEPGLWTILIAVGMVITSCFLVFFLIKFLFKSQQADRSHLIEIQEKDAPYLYEMIRELVAQVGTNFPKKIYISPEVNAGVFYDSSFWSMFLPVRKNLQIGLGLLNAVTDQELKAILAHEFGHFSQGSMKVGSFVHQFNKIIHNLLYDNDGFQEALNKLSNVSWVFDIFVYLALWVVRFFQWILKGVYNFMNKAYLGLSRQMEFHADAIAATVVAPQALINSLLRLDLTDQSYQSVLYYYNGKLEQKVGTKNFYTQQLLVMNHLAQTQQLGFKNGLPDVRLNDFRAQQNSKINFEDQWASHPNLEDRIKHLNTFDKNESQPTEQPVRSRIPNILQWEEKATQDAFKQIYRKGIQEWITDPMFEQEYQEQQIAYQFPKLFNGYFDRYNLFFVPIEERVFDHAKRYSGTPPIFNKDQINKTHQYKTLENDIANLEQIKQGYLKVKSFDYAGQKYKAKQAKTILPTLENEKETIKTDLLNFDKHIFFYYWQAHPEGQERAQYLETYKDYAHLDEEFESLFLAHRSMIQHTDFFAQQLPIATIEKLLKTLAPMEKRFKDAVQVLLEFKPKGIFPNSEISTDLEKYTAQKWTYFLGDRYDEAALEVLSKALNHFPLFLDEVYFLIKKRWLEQVAKAPQL